MTHLFRTFWTKSTATVLLDSVMSEVFFGRVILVGFFLKILFNLQGEKKQMLEIQKKVSLNRSNVSNPVFTGSQATSFI